MTTYRYANTKVPGIDADEAFRLLEEIRVGGSLTPKRVVEEARPKDAPLHPAFEWNNGKAAESWREHQARNLIRSVVIVKEDRPNTPVFVHVNSPSSGQPDQRYEHVDVVVTRPDLFAAALTELERRVSSAAQAAQVLRQHAEESADGDQLAKVALAVRALETASDAIRSLH